MGGVGGGVLQSREGVYAVKFHGKPKEASAGFQRWLSILLHRHWKVTLLEGICILQFLAPLWQLFVMIWWRIWGGKRKKKRKDKLTSRRSMVTVQKMLCVCVVCVRLVHPTPIFGEKKKRKSPLNLLVMQMQFLSSKHSPVFQMLVFYVLLYFSKSLLQLVNTICSNDKEIPLVIKMTFLHFAIS